MSTFQIWDPDLAPASPSAYDDEFNGGPGLGGIWTTVNWGSLLASDVNTTIPGCLYEKYYSASETTLITAEQAIPAGDFTVFTKIASSAVEGTVTASGIGFILSDGVTAGAGEQYIGWSNYNAGNRNTASAYAYTNFTTMGTGTDSYTPHINYLRLRRSGTSYYLATSTDGKTWGEGGALPLTFTPTYFGLMVRANPGSTQYVIFSFEFFRYSPSATAQLGGYRTYVS